MKELIFAAALSALTAPVYGAAIFRLGNNAQPGEENVFFQTSQSAISVTGVASGSNAVVEFSSTTDTLVTKPKGQADLVAASGLLNEISISLTGGELFRDLVLNPSVRPKTQSGTTTVTAALNDGVKSTFAYPKGLGSGENWLTITTSGSELISSVTITSTGGFDELKQVRISGIIVPSTVPAPASVPEPATLAVGGVGLAFLGMLQKIRRS